MTLGEALDATWATLAASGVEQPRREARLLAAHVLGQTPTAWLDPAREVDAGALAVLTARRAAREPLAFVTGRRGFWTLELEVSPETLIPRPDSEAVIEAALDALPRRADVRRILDLGTGTGCLLLAALTEYPEAFGVGIDLAPGAAALAHRNAAANGVGPRAAFLAGNWAQAVQGRFDLMLCNPPYIASGDLAGLAPEVARYEPWRALDGGPDGMDAYKWLLPAVPMLLNPGGVAVFELGQGQAGPVGRLASCSGLDVIGLQPDLGGTERALVVARRIQNEHVYRFG